MTQLIYTLTAHHATLGAYESDFKTLKSATRDLRIWVNNPNIETTTIQLNITEKTK